MSQEIPSCPQQTRQSEESLELIALFSQISGGVREALSVLNDPRLTAHPETLDGFCRSIRAARRCLLTELLRMQVVSQQVLQQISGSDPKP